jgi:cadmium resistance transport/sequestration family protein
MPGLIVTGILTFAATNIDDILLLVVFFSQANTSLTNASLTKTPFRPRHVVVGQYLGFSILVGVSLLGFLGRLVIPQPWIGILGLAPIFIGVRKFLGRNKVDEVTKSKKPGPQPVRPFVFDTLLNSYTYQVAVVTVANGGDNIGIYTPLFASSSLAELSILLGVFFALVGVWCLVGYRLTHRPAIVTFMTHYGHTLVPFILIGLGVFILVESGTLSLIGL